VQAGAALRWGLDLTAAWRTTLASQLPVASRVVSLTFSSPLCRTHLRQRLLRTPAPPPELQAATPPRLITSPSGSDTLGAAMRTPLSLSLPVDSTPCSAHLARPAVGSRTVLVRVVWCQTSRRETRTGWCRDVGFLDVTGRDKCSRAHRRPRPLFQHLSLLDTATPPTASGPTTSR